MGILPLLNSALSNLWVFFFFLTEIILCGEAIFDTFPLEYLRPPLALTPTPAAGLILCL